MSPCHQKSFITHETRVRSSQDNAMQGGVCGGSGMAIFFSSRFICFMWQRAEFANVAKHLARSNQSLSLVKLKGVTALHCTALTSPPTR